MTNMKRTAKKKTWMWAAEIVGKTIHLWTKKEIDEVVVYRDKDAYKFTLPKKSP